MQQSVAVVAVAVAVGVAVTRDKPQTRAGLLVEDFPPRLSPRTGKAGKQASRMANGINGNSQSMTELAWPLARELCLQALRTQRLSIPMQLPG